MSKSPAVMTKVGPGLNFSLGVKIGPWLARTQKVLRIYGAVGIDSSP